MKKDLQTIFAAKVEAFSLPRYHELPTIGLYLEQVTKYINGYLEPLGCSELTSSMVSNYVKKGVICAPEKKLYSNEQIAYLFFIAVAKNVLSIENIATLFTMQKTTYDSPIAFNYFCSELENMLGYLAGLKDTVDTIGKSNTEVKSVLRSVITSASHMIFVNHCFEIIKVKKPEKKSK